MRNATSRLMTCALMLSLMACHGPSSTNSVAAETEKTQPVGPVFQADSAFSFCQEQCNFGPRTMNSQAHEACRQWIAARFAAYGLSVTQQHATLEGYDGTRLASTNIIAAYRPELKARIMLCAHYDSRPWADNDPNPDNHHTPILAANDGASGVGVMLELARLVTQPDSAMQPAVGIDFICFDAEDWGTPQWDERDYGDHGNPWALGAQYWARHPHTTPYQPRFGILLDMVGGQGARFYREGYSMREASHVVKRVWQAARTVGAAAYFPKKDGAYVTDDHVPVIEEAGIPCIDIIPFDPTGDSSFGPTWHTVSDDMDHLDRETLRAVGQTLVQVIYSEK